MEKGGTEVEREGGNETEEEEEGDEKNMSEKGTGGQREPPAHPRPAGRSAACWRRSSSRCSGRTCERGGTGNQADARMWAMVYVLIFLIARGRCLRWQYRGGGQQSAEVSDWPCQRLETGG